MEEHRDNVEERKEVEQEAEVLPTITKEKPPVEQATPKSQFKHNEKD